MPLYRIIHHIHYKPGKTNNLLTIFFLISTTPLFLVGLKLNHIVLAIGHLTNQATVQPVFIQRIHPNPPLVKVPCASGENPPVPARLSTPSPSFRTGTYDQCSEYTSVGDRTLNPVFVKKKEFHQD